LKNRAFPNDSLGERPSAAILADEVKKTPVAIKANVNLNVLLVFITPPFLLKNWIES
jgi:hypothetical protein